MIIVDNVIVSDEFINARFCCHLARCKGECCVAGDAGAPLEPEEVGLIEENIDFTEEDKNKINESLRKVNKFYS